MPLKSLIHCESKWHSLLLLFLGGRLDSPADRQQLSSGRLSRLLVQLSAHAIARLIEFGFSFINIGTVAGQRC